MHARALDHLAAIALGARTVAARVAGGARKTALRHPGRVGFASALAAAALVLRGAAAPLAAIFALLLLGDAVVPLPGATWSEADDRFWRLVRERRKARLWARLRARAPEQLEVIDETQAWFAAAPRQALGVQLIAIDAVTGTVEASKAASFDGRFRPQPSVHERWKGVWLASARETGVPAVAVYRLGDSYVVRDGHHRISVARARGDATVEAEVVEVGARRGSAAR